MLEERDLSTDRLLDVWREAEAEVDGTAIGTKEHGEAVRRSQEARQAYQRRLDVMRQDLRDG